MNAAHDTQAFPHPVHCTACAQDLRCSNCGSVESFAVGHCSSGRCAACHMWVCPLRTLASGDRPPCELALQQRDGPIVERMQDEWLRGPL